MTSNSKTPGTGRQRDRPPATPSRPRRKQHGQQNGREASRAAEKPVDRLKTIRQAENNRTAERPAERHRERRKQQSNSQTKQTNKKNNPPENKQNAKTEKHIASKMFHVEQWRTPKLSTNRKMCRQILIVSRQILIVREDQRARFFLSLMKRMKGKLQK